MMTKKIKQNIVATTLSDAPSAFHAAADVPPPAGENLLTKVLAWPGAPISGVPEKFLLKHNDRIVAIGDSITEGGGYLRDSDAALAELYPALRLPRIVNAGIGGQKAEDLVKRFQQNVVDRKPNIVLVNVGINDVWHRLCAPHDPMVLKAYKKNIGAMADMAHAGGVTVVLLTPTLIQEDPEAEGNQRLVHYVDAMKAVANEKKCGLADLHGMFLEALKHKPAAVSGPWLTTDGVHMSPLGNAVMAVGVLRALGVPDKDMVRLK